MTLTGSQDNNANFIGSAVIEQLMNLIDTPVANIRANQVVTQPVSLSDAVAIAWLKIITEVVTITPTGAGFLQHLCRLTEHLRATGVVDSLHKAVEAVTLALILAEQWASGLGFTAAESITITPLIAQQYRVIATQIEQALMTATPSMAVRFSVPVTDRLVASGAAFSSAVLRELIAEGVAFELSFGIGDETYRGWVMNTRNFGLTEYQGYPFNSMTKFKGICLGANGNGLYRLDGATDAGTDIAWRLQTGQVAFPHKGNIAEAWLGFRSDGKMMLKTITADKVERWYEVRGGAGEMENKMTPLAKGVYSGLWQLELSGTKPVRLDSIELIPVIWRT
jgi:hypothetical protein